MIKVELITVIWQCEMDGTDRRKNVQTYMIQWDSFNEKEGDL